MTPDHFLLVMQEIIDLNPFAIRAALRILTVEFTDQVPTLAVTCESRPRLLVNLDFVTRHARTETQVKALVMHEFLHVLLRHTEGRQPLTPARHLAFDAVINAIIHRHFGSQCSSLMSEYYANAKGVMRLLRPMTAVEAEDFRLRRSAMPDWFKAWAALYEGKLIADDIAELADSLGGLMKMPVLLGNHADLGTDMDGPLGEALAEAVCQARPDGLWRSGRSSAGARRTLEAVADIAPVKRWEAKTLAVLRRHLTPDRRSKSSREQSITYRLPVLSPGDRRAFLRTLWSPVLADADWTGQACKPEGTTQVYLDVSGSMNSEMPAIIGLLNRLRRHIRRPFWAFSDRVEPARIEGSRLVTATTGGTSMACVLRHLEATRPAAAVVVTDGFIEALSREQVAVAAGTRLHVLVTRSGNPRLIARAGLPYTQLERLPS